MIVAFGGIAPTGVALGAGPMEAVDRGADDRTTGGFDRNAQFVGQGRLARRGPSIDRDTKVINRQRHDTRPSRPEERERVITLARYGRQSGVSVSMARLTVSTSRSITAFRAGVGKRFGRVRMNILLS